ncbi:MAG: DoxX family protein [Acidimicrobiaceae bacterium]|jgi:putative oxidoreductase|nr:DoxX family protein [Acidimicrobiaceae bacterium]MEC9059647.1 DoxX family protein [Actinomycetota bacterium]MED5361741.1 DoxX family protein [Actinomycetota bacterium]|tara:strand:- start:636 stop:1133 length:498 start_codon:yes stop_codon:yes gene_type:complete
MDQNALDLGLLLLRLTLGVTLALHGVAKYRGGIDGVGRWFQSEGLKPGIVHAHLAASGEIGFGCAIAVGFLTPLSAMGFVGVMCVAGWVGHRQNGFFIIKDGWEYVFVLAVTASSLALFGPGAWSLDNAIGIKWAGIGWFAAAVIGGVGAALTLLLALYRPDGEG